MEMAFELNHQQTSTIQPYNVHYKIGDEERKTKSQPTVLQREHMNLQSGGNVGTHLMLRLAGLTCK